MSLFKFIDYRNAPIKSGLLVGIFGGLLIIVVAGALSLFLIMLEKGSGGVGGAGGLIGFVVLPAVFFAGAPWSLFLFGDTPSLYGLALPVIVGVSINSIIVGTIIGMVAKVRNGRDKSDEFTIHE